jgi:hypothetical protein
MLPYRQWVIVISRSPTDQLPAGTCQSWHEECCTISLTFDEEVDDMIISGCGILEVSGFSPQPLVSSRSVL